MEDVKKEFEALENSEHCGVGSMAFDSLNLIKKRVKERTYTNTKEVHDHLDCLDTLAKKVKKIADAKHQNLCADAEKILIKICEVRELLVAEYKKQAGTAHPAKQRRHKYIGVGLRGIGAGSVKQGLAGGKY